MSSIDDSRPQRGSAAGEGTNLAAADTRLWQHRWLPSTDHPGASDDPLGRCDVADGEG